MNLKNSTVNKLAKSIMDDIMIDFTTLKTAYLEGNEFKALVAIEVDNINVLLDKANEMYDAVEKVPENSFITLGRYIFKYNKELDTFEHNNIEETAKDIVVANLAFDIYRGYNATNKTTYIEHKVEAIVSTLDESINHNQALKIVREQIDLNEILHNKNI